MQADSSVPNSGRLFSKAVLVSFRVADHPTTVCYPLSRVYLPARRSEGCRTRRAGLSVFSGNAFDTINYQDIDRRLAGFQP